MKFQPLLFLFTFFYLLPIAVDAQDPHFSQFYSNKVYLNPAYAGFDANWSFNINYRNQWLGVPDATVGRFSDSYSTYNISVEKQLSCLYDRKDMNLGIALSAFSDQAGTQPLITQGGGLALAYEYQMVDKVRISSQKLKRLDFRVGTQMSFMQRSIGGDYFIYSNQLDPVRGLNGMDPSQLTLNSRFYPVLNAGFMVRGNFQYNNYRYNLFTAGLTFANINNPDYSLYNSASTSNLPTRTTFHLGFIFNVPKFSGVKKSPILFAPQFRWDRQGKKYTFTSNTLNTQTVGFYTLSKGYYFGAFYQYNFPNYRNPFTGQSNGIAVANNTSVLIFNFGVDIKTLSDTDTRWAKRKEGLILGLTYDWNLSGLNQSNTLGVLEMSIRINLDKEKPGRCGLVGKFELQDGYKGGCPVMF